MASARQIHSVADVGRIRLTKRSLLAATAVTMAALCGGAAFFFPLLRDHSHANVMVNEQSAPALLEKNYSPAVHSHPIVSAPAIPTSPAPRPVPNGLIGTGIKNPFIVGKGKRATLGPVKLRLTSTNPSNGTYDVNVAVGRRAFSHASIKLNQPLWIVVNRGANSFGMVAVSMDVATITGYWTQSNHAPQVKAHSRSKRH